MLLKIYWSIIGFYYNNSNKYVAIATIRSIPSNTSLEASLTPYNSNKFKSTYDLVVGEHQGVIELVIIIIHFAQKSKQMM